ncbi:alpha/beta fold hydrolase [Egicoccus halophilus]|uniref:Dihydrolipoamide acetyltransferase n=1 Tax=Egicoccus halophilus TaxID=1670830 RepID=A0A8J3A5F2_9ACTN|nr:alpha/beta fold hydrolase [Egicoccus halophilus]GGI02841.1 dihydrolipoamide acetyltransferase [Egicoccus halophilus]
MTTTTAAPTAPAPRWHEARAGRWRIASRVWQRHDTTGRRPVVLVHGLVISSAYLVPLAQHLAVRRTVHALDLPGFGRSRDPRPDRALDTRELGQALIDWLDARGLRDVALVANSYGNQIAAEVALRRPDLVGALVLLAPTMDPRARRYDEQLRRWRMEMKTQTGALQRLMVRDYLRAGLGRAIATFRHAMADAIEDKLPFLDVPALVVHGSEDPMVEDRWAREVADLLPDAQRRRLPGATHAINHEQPLQTARVVAAFLDDLDDTDGERRPTAGRPSPVRAA